jgi:hypothetical protein
VLLSSIVTVLGLVGERFERSEIPSVSLDTSFAGSPDDLRAVEPAVAPAAARLQEDSSPLDAVPRAASVDEADK